MSFEKRSAERRERMVAHRARSYADAERWDLDFWQSVTPEVATITKWQRELGHS